MTFLETFRIYYALFQQIMADLAGLLVEGSEVTLVGMGFLELCLNEYRYMFALNYCVTGNTVDLLFYL